MQKRSGLILLSAASMLSTSISFAATTVRAIGVDTQESTRAVRIIKQAAEEPATPLNELGFDQDEAYPSDIGGYWSYSSIHYYRFTKAGVFGARVNYANRYANGGVQYQLEAYPKLFGKSYLELTAAKSNTSQRVFPKYQYTIEPYFSLPCAYELSIGQRYLRAYDVNIYTYTGSIGKYYKNYFFWFRPYMYTPKSVSFFEAGFRYYSTVEENKFFTIRVGTGKTPDIGDVPPFNQIVTSSTQMIAVDGQLPIRKDLFVKAGAGYMRQVYQGGNKRETYDGSVGIIWRF